MGGYHQSSEQIQTRHYFVHNDLKYNLFKFTEILEQWKFTTERYLQQAISILKQFFYYDNPTGRDSISTDSIIILLVIQVWMPLRTQSH